MPLPFGSVAPLLQPDHLKSHGYGPEVADVLATRSTSSPSTWEKNPSTVQNTNDLGGTAALHPFHPHDIPLFASAQNCTININYGPSHINVAQDNRRFDGVDFPEQRELACIE